MSIRNKLISGLAALAVLAGAVAPSAAGAQGLPQAGPPWTTVPAPVAGAFGPRPQPVASGAVSRGLAVDGSEVFEVVPLRYADVSEVAGLLTGDPTIRSNDSFIPQEPAFGSASFQGYYGGGGIPTPPGGASFSQQGASTDSVGRAIDETVGIDRRLNAIVLRGTPDRVARLKAQISQLDVPVTSVVLETVFVELTESGARNLGIDFNNASGQVANAAYALTRGDFPGLPNTSRSGGKFFNLQAAIYAQVDKGQGRIVSRPRIAAQSGSSAKIVTGDALPILTSIALSGVNAVQQQVQYVNVGVTLQIAPRVSSDGFVTSHVFAVVSSVTGFSQGYPTISQREASTSATVRDGESFVIGGLIQESDLSHRIKIPGLGDIPVLGRVFDAQHRNRTKTDLYIMVTPHVVSGREAAAAQALPAKPAN